MDYGGIIAIVIGLAMFWGLVVGVTLRLASRFVTGDNITWPSALWSAVLGLIVLFGLFGLAISSALSAGVAQGSPAIMGIAFGSLVVSFLAASTINWFLMRRANGARLTFGQACRMQILPTIAIIGFAVVSRL